MQVLHPKNECLLSELTFTSDRAVLSGNVYDHEWNTRAPAPSAEPMGTEKLALDTAMKCQRESEGEEPESYEFARTILAPIIRSAFDLLTNCSTEPPKARRSAEEPTEDIRKIKLALGYCGVPTEEADWVYADAVAALDRLTNFSAEIRDRALEEAVKIVETSKGYPTEVSEKIRALKSQPLAPTTTLETINFMMSVTPEGGLQSEATGKSLAPSGNERER